LRSRNINNERIVIVGLLALVIIVLFQDVIGQEEQKTIRHEVSAILKLVPVRVFDHEGRPVLDLTQNDFVLYDNKERKDLTEFECHDLEVDESDPTDTRPGLSSRPEVLRKFFVVLDLAGSGETGISNAKAAALHFIATALRPGDEVSVLSWSRTRGLNLEVYLTSDRDSIRKAIMRPKEIPVSHNSALRPRLSLISPVEDERTSSAKRDSSDNEASNELWSAFGLGSPSLWLGGLWSESRDGMDYVNNMGELAEALRYIPGNKSVLFFSGFGSAAVFSQKLGVKFAQAGVPVYAINTHKLYISETANISLRRIYGEVGSLKEFAMASGGKYYDNVHNIVDIAEDIQIHSSQYYILGYYINESWDGQFHRIEIEVKRPCCTVMSQAGYYNPRPYEVLTDFEKKLQLHDLFYAEKPIIQSYLDVPTVAIVTRAAETATVLFLSRMVADESLGIRAGGLEINYFVFDEGHKPVIANVGKALLQELDQAILFPYHVAFLSPGQYQYRIVVRDVKTGKALLGRADVQIRKYTLLSLSVASPLVLAPGREPVFLRLSSEYEGEEKATSIIDLFPMLPRKHFPVVKELDKGTVKLSAVVPLRISMKPAPLIDLTASLVQSREKTRIPLDIEIVDSLDVFPDTVVFHVEIHLPGITEGLYELEIGVYEAKSKTSSFVKTELFFR
jgi:VWFA-related protein